jgi:hypothetical protein
MHALAGTDSNKDETNNGTKERKLREQGPAFLRRPLGTAK